MTMYPVVVGDGDHEKQFGEDDVLIRQYRFWKIMLIWAAATLPMALISWVVAPAMADDPSHPGLERLALMTVGLIWQFVPGLRKRASGRDTSGGLWCR